MIQAGSAMLALWARRAANPSDKLRLAHVCAFLRMRCGCYEFPKFLSTLVRLTVLDALTLIHNYFYSALELSYIQGKDNHDGCQHHKSRRRHKHQPVRVNLRLQNHQRCGFGT